VVFEIHTFSIADVEAVAKAVRVEVSQQIGVTPTRVVAITEKSRPKTTSGKIQRGATRTALHDGKLNVILDSVDVKPIAQNRQGPQVSEDLPTDVLLPQIALDAIHAINADSGRHDSYLKSFRLEKVPSITEAWRSADKSTSAVQAMCEMSIRALVLHYPAIMMQSVHWLASNPDWILTDSQEQLSEIVHYGFVME
jgi:hypothetical protein